MTVSENKVIKNVFVSAGENYLKLVDIYFSNEINRIVSLIDQKIPWSEISDIDKKSAFIEKLAIPPAPEAEKIYRHLGIFCGAFTGNQYALFKEWRDEESSKEPCLHPLCWFKTKSWRRE